VMYFRHVDDHGPMHRRLELIVKGYHEQLLEAHLGPASEAAPQHAKTLLQLMTGAWATQALAAAAELGLADHLARHDGATSEDLAELTGTDRDALDRLLRYLAGLGIVRSARGGYELTDVGQLLRSDIDHSLQPLALMYGGPFYRSFESLMHTMRTGQEAFAHVFGKHHFAYFAERPELATLFDRAMASSAAMFAPLPDVVDFTSARVVVDVAGGNGALLGQILRATPHLRGILLERPHAIEAARATLARAGCEDRCELLVGDFTDAVPSGGDVYVLSRVLHDWSDEQCRAILARCAEAMPAGADLLVVERLLPEDDAPSLARAWDLHMMCNVGGRERTASHYRRLLGESGFDLVRHHPLPLDGALLCARRRPEGALERTDSAA
jgi:hypothetical protein